jgi:YD repeat-containing protein
MRMGMTVFGGFAALALISVSSSAAEMQTYTYDALGRVVKVQNSGTVNNNQVRSFCYDKVGNRITYSSNGTNTPAACVTQG